MKMKYSARFYVSTVFALLGSTHMVQADVVNAFSPSYNITFQQDNLNTDNSLRNEVLFFGYAKSDIDFSLGVESAEQRELAEKYAKVCFITDVAECSGAGAGTDDPSSSSGGPGPVDPDGDEMCRLEGYVNTVCDATQDEGLSCPHSSGWHTGCKCKPEYSKACNGTDEQGKGAACNGKYKECCKKCTGYDYTASNIPTGYVKNGSCESCDGTKYKIRCNTNSSNTGTYVDCGTASGSGSSCTDDTGTYYTKCTCPTNYEWSASAKKCVCSTGFKYSCTGSNIKGGEGNSCDNKYQKCVCQTGFTWDAASGMCVCNGTDWCTLNQDCAALGYKKQTCTSGTTLRCPFDITYVVCG